MIPTALKFQLIKWEQTYGSDPMYIDELSEYEIAEYMIEFAQMHVKAALEKASKDAETGGGDGYGWVDKGSILDAYPLTNIK